MAYEWRKSEKNLYLPKAEPSVLTIARQSFLMLPGEGNPNRPAFAEQVGVLYALAYAIRMMPKQGFTPPGYLEYTVYPLEGEWDLSEQGRQQARLDKDELRYTLMIRQPDFVTPDVFERALAAVRKKKPHVLLDALTFEQQEQGLSLQTLHVGPYDDEPRSFRQMDDFMASHGLQRRVLTHREIYLSDARKVDPARLKTVLRYQVRAVAG